MLRCNKDNENIDGASNRHRLTVKAGRKWFFTPKNNLFTKRFVENIDIQTIDYFENSDKPYKTYSSFPQLTLDAVDTKAQFNQKVIFLNNKKNKRINEIAWKFLDKKIKKNNFNQSPNIFSHRTINVLKERTNNGDNK